MVYLGKRADELENEREAGRALYACFSRASCGNRATHCAAADQVSTKNHAPPGSTQKARVVIPLG